MLKNEDLTLTDDQQAGLYKLIEWATNKDTQFKTLMGYAGTGKTTLLDYFVNHMMHEEDAKVAVTATTNKAVKVLVEKVEASTFMTIHSLLNIKPIQKGTKEVFEPVTYNKKDISGYDVIVIDECSMISKKLLRIIESQILPLDIKVLFCGDPAQLQPINEDKSACFDFDPIELVEIIRYGNTIAKKAAIVRDSTSYHDPSELIEEPEISYITLSEAQDLFKDWHRHPDNARLLCWTNKAVNGWNQKMRVQDMGNTELPIAPGDILMANSPCMKGDWVFLANSEEACVIEVEERYDCYATKARTENGKEVELNILKADYYQEWKKDLDSFAAAKNWGAYWAEKKKYHDVKHCYALTTHKSQGSTYKNVVIDPRDIMKNKDAQNRNQLLYVALTRASERVYILK